MNTVGDRSRLPYNCPDLIAGDEILIGRRKQDDLKTKARIMKVNMLLYVYGHDSRMPSVFLLKRSRRGETLVGNWVRIPLHPAGVKRLAKAHIGYEWGAEEGHAI